MGSSVAESDEAATRACGFDSLLTRLFFSFFFFFFFTPPKNADVPGDKVAEVECPTAVCVEDKAGALILCPEPIAKLNEREEE